MLSRIFLLTAFVALGFAANVGLGGCQAKDAREATTSAANATASATPIPAASTQQAAANAQTDGPPTENGVYVFPDCEGEGGCPFRNWRAIDATRLLAQQEVNTA